MKHITLFDTTTQYNNATLDLPNVSLTLDDRQVHYNPYIDYSKEYLTCVALEDGTISFNIWKDMGTEYITSISYSTDNGETWTTTNNTNGKSENLTISVNVNEGDKVLWKGDAQQMAYFSKEVADYVGSFFSSTAEFGIQGNVMSLLYGDDFKGEDTLEYKGQFAYLFCDFNEENVCKVVNARNLSLPATTLTEECYNGMFYGCTSLITAPQLPATTLARNCYQEMFSGCTSLTTTPKLPATTLADWCYRSMFYGCISLTIAPELPATTLASSCYSSMFQGCTSLITAPQLPATTLTNGCYNGMFAVCTSLTTAPELPATTLASSCYGNMFADCTSLITAPQLPATTLTNGCYNGMFYNCTSLNYIKAMFTTTPSISYTSNWVKNVSASGTFVKNSAATWDVTGINGIPSGWTVENIVETRLVCTYNVTSTSSAIRILYDSSNISAIEIDGTTLDNVVDTYTFSTTGEHTVKYTLTDNTNINRIAFYYCEMISMIIPNSVTSIDAGAFSDCSSLTSVTIPNSVTSIGEEAFSNCNSLASVIIKDGVTSIDSKAFSSCPHLNSVTIGTGITSIGDSVFEDCMSLRTLIVQATTPPSLGSQALYHVIPNVIKVPSASVNAYKSAPGWSGYASYIQAI